MIGSRALNGLLYGVALTVSLCFLATIAIRIANARTEKRAERLLRSVRTLRVGSSTAQDVEAITRRFPSEAVGASSDCPRADRVYSFRVADDTMNWIGGRVPALRKIGIRPAGVVAMVLLDQGIVCSVYFDVETTPDTSDREVKASTSLGPVRHEPSFADPRYRVWLRLIRAHIRALDVRISPAVKDERHAHAFDYDFSCVARWNGCRAPCELMPSAWFDYQKEARANGWSLPAEDAGDPRCPKLSGN